MNKTVKIGMAVVGVLALVSAGLMYLDSDNAKITIPKPRIDHPKEAEKTSDGSPAKASPGLTHVESTNDTMSRNRQIVSTVKEKPEVAVSHPVPSESRNVPQPSSRPSASVAVSEGRGAVSGTVAQYYGMGDSGKAGAQSRNKVGRENSGGESTFLFDTQLKRALESTVKTLVDEKVSKIREEIERRDGADKEKVVAAPASASHSESKVVKGKIVEIHEIPTMLYFSSREVIGGKIALVTDTGILLTRGIAYSGGKILSIDKSNIRLDIGGKTYTIPYIVTYGDTNHPQPAYRTVKIEKSYTRKSKEKVKVESVVYRGIGGKSASMGAANFNHGEEEADEGASSAGN